MNRFLLLLAFFFCLRVDEPDDPPDPVDPPGGADAPDSPDAPDPDGDIDLEALTGGGEPDDPDQPAAADHKRLVAEATARAEKAEREAAEARAAALRFQQQTNPQKSHEQVLFEAEEAKLKDPATNDWEKWQIQTNRTLRHSERQAQFAAAQTADLNDRHAYDKLAETSPLAKKYGTRVEDKLKEIRSAGNNIDRRTLLMLIVGQDIVEGKVKTAKKAATKPADQPAAPRGGRTPQLARSDIRRGAVSSESEKRRQRLEGRTI